MKILFDITHPAHAHFFYHSILSLQQAGHKVLITSRNKDILLDLLDELKLPHTPLLTATPKGLVSFATAMLHRDYVLYKVVSQFRPNVMVAIGGTFVAHVGKLTGIPSLVFYDTENASLQNAITYPLATQVFVPTCYQAWLPKKHLRYHGYHELAYLHPEYFIPDKAVAIANGLAEQGDTFFLRLVSWQANHDIGEQGWSIALLTQLVNKLAPLGKILISSESVLPKQFEKYRYSGHYHEVHQVLAHCRAFIGESATMASECAVLGIPAIYMAKTGRGYTDEQERKFGLVKNISQLKWPLLDKALIETLSISRNEYQQRRKRLLAETINVSQFINDCILVYSKNDP